MAMAAKRHNRSISLALASQRQPDCRKFRRQLLGCPRAARVFPMAGKDGAAGNGLHVPRPSPPPAVSSPFLAHACTSYACVSI